MDVKAGDAFQNALIPEIDREVSAQLGIPFAEFFQAPQPLLCCEGRERSMASHQRSLQDLERFRDVDAFSWFSPRAKRHIGEIAIVHQSVVRCQFKGMNDGHRGFLSQRLET
jgi:hypothetical protein